MITLMNNVDKTKNRTLKAHLTDKDLEAFKASHAPVSQVEALASIVRWFSEQDEVIRKEILGLLPKGYQIDLAKLLLQRMAGELDESSIRPKAYKGSRPKKAASARKGKPRSVKKPKGG